MASVRSQPLDRVRNTAGKQPQIALGHVVDKAAALRVHGRDPRVAVDHECPLGAGVPMQLAHPARDQPHLYPGQVFDMGSSLSVTCRVQPPSSMRLCASAKEYLNGSTVPLSVSGDHTELGFSASRAVLFSPGCSSFG